MVFDRRKDKMSADLYDAIYSDIHNKSNMRGLVYYDSNSGFFVLVGKYGGQVDNTGHTYGPVYTKFSVFHKCTYKTPLGIKTATCYSHNIDYDYIENEVRINYKYYSELKFKSESDLLDYIIRKEG